jgi:hypothetical protein
MDRNDHRPDSNCRRIAIEPEAVVIIQAKSVLGAWGGPTSEKTTLRAVVVYGIRERDIGPRYGTVA